MGRTLVSFLGPVLSALIVFSLGTFLGTLLTPTQMKSIPIQLIYSVRNQQTLALPLNTVTSSTSSTELETTIPDFKKIANMPTLDFLSKYKNPCWREVVSARGRRPAMKIRCLPYYYIVGQPKCGTTDLYNTLNRHPNIAPCAMKEPHWWARRRVGKGPVNKKIKPVPLETYIKYFDGAATRIAENGSHRCMITGEASASTLWDNDQWMWSPGNVQLGQPKYLTAHYMRALQPAARIIVILRNPTDRLFSDYLYFTPNKKKAAENFHELVVNAVDAMGDCMTRNGLKNCVYNGTLAYSLGVRLRLGMYHAYIRDWLEVFPRDQIYITRLEDYAVDRLAVLEEIYTFLNLAQLPAEIASTIESKAVSNRRKAANKKVGAMLEKTGAILDDFYGKYNRMLADLLGDKRFLWQ